MSSNRIHPLQEDLEGKTKEGGTIHVIEASVEEGEQAEIINEGKLRFNSSIFHPIQELSSHSYSCLF